MKTKTRKNRVVLLCTALLLMLSAVSAFTLTPVFAKAAPLPAEVYYMDDGYNGDNGGHVDDTQVIVCDSYDVVEQNIIGTTPPNYMNTDNNKSNMCAPVAGSIVVGYYDRWSTNLIPGFTPGMSLGGNYGYFAQSTKNQVHIQGLIDNLYSDMGTNAVQAGTTQTQFQNGMESYVTGQGYDVSYTSMMSNGSINLNTLNAQLNNKKVSALFLSTYNFISTIYPMEGKVTLYKENSTLAHIMVCYGYKIYRYYKDGVNFQTDTYLSVMSVWNTQQVGFIRLNDNCITLNDAVAIDIY